MCACMRLNCLLGCTSHATGDQGLLGMAVGEERLLVIPAKEGCECANLLTAM